MPAPEENIEDLSFEAALSEVEELSSAMEDHRLPLADLVSSYERGNLLLKVCRKRLDEALGRVEMMKKKASGEIVLEPVEADMVPTATAGGARSRPAAKKTSTRVAISSPLDDLNDDEIPF